MPVFEWVTKQVACALRVWDSKRLSIFLAKAPAGNAKPRADSVGLESRLQLSHHSFGLVLQVFPFRLQVSHLGHRLVLFLLQVLNLGKDALPVLPVGILSLALELVYLRLKLIRVIARLAGVLYLVYIHSAQEDVSVGPELRADCVRAICRGSRRSDRRLCL